MGMFNKNHEKLNICAQSTWVASIQKMTFNISNYKDGIAAKREKRNILLSKTKPENSKT